MGAADVMYERFDKNLQAVNGNSWLAAVPEAADIIVNAFKERGIKDTCLCETPLLKEMGLKKALEDAGITVYTDHIRLQAGLRGLYIPYLPYPVSVCCCQTASGLRESHQCVSWLSWTVCLPLLLGSIGCGRI